MTRETGKKRAPAVKRHAIAIEGDQPVIGRGVELDIVGHDGPHAVVAGRQLQFEAAQHRTRVQRDKRRPEFPIH